MTKFDLIQMLSKREGLSEKAAADVINLIFNGFVETLKGGGRIEFRGFGTFVVREYKSYLGRNPKTGTQINVNPKRLPFFQAGKELKKSLQTS